VKEIRTERLILRDWHAADLDRWAEINADPEVREFLGGLWTVTEAAASMEHYQSEYERNGFGFWALAELPTQTSAGRLVGMAGLDVVDPETPFDGVEIGWRLARDAWGRGYATEAARAVFAEAFDVLGLDEVYALTEANNVRSQAVMRRLGMAYEPAKDFDDQVVFRLARSEFVRLRGEVRA
jgi:RimJ/RimL family protein N-acetyltransferase